MVDSEAFKALKPQAICILIQILRRYNGRNNGEISLSIREAAQFGKCGKDKASACLQQLQDHGFIRMVTKGMYTYAREASTWRLTFRASDRGNGSAATNEWKEWKPPETPSSKNKK